MGPSFSLKLPYDILITVFTQLKRVSTTTQDLTSCSLVNHQWHEATTPILYGNIALKQHNVIRLCEHWKTSRYAACVQSLIISFQPYDYDEPLAQIAALLPFFKNLLSFSFWLGKGKYYHTISHTNLVLLLEALPISCTNLERDTFGFDVRERGGAHLCDALRKIIPKMQHVRLRLRSCEALFTDPSTPGRFVQLPNLKTFMYNCSRPLGTPLPTCCCEANYPISHDHTHLVWETVTASLTKMIAAQAAIRKDAKIYACMTTADRKNDITLWQAHIRADMRSRSSIALPYRDTRLVNMVCGSWMVRLSDSSELMTTPFNIEAIVEGQLWREVFGGARLPAAVLAEERVGKPSFAVGCVERKLALLKTDQQWRDENPVNTNSVWDRERRLGYSMLRAEERKGKGKGKDGYLSLRLIRESAPTEWQNV